MPSCKPLGIATLPGHALRFHKRSTDKSGKCNAFASGNDKSVIGVLFSFDPAESKYLNNLIEQDHRGVKQRIAVMAGFKDFKNAAITIASIELMHRIRKGQFALARLGVQGQAASTIWNALLTA
jgi:transposase-like protein